MLKVLETISSAAESASIASAETPSRSAGFHPGFIALVAIKFSVSAVFPLGRLERQFFNRGTALGAGDIHRRNIMHLPLRAVVILISH
jgi:hypothetical protein